MNKMYKWRPWLSSASSSRSPPGPPWWTKCRGWTPPGSSWSAGPAQPAGWSLPGLSSARSGRLRGLHAAPGSPPRSCISLGPSGPLLRSRTSCWKLMPSWRKSGTSPQPGVEVEKIFNVLHVKWFTRTWTVILLVQKPETSPLPFWSALEPPEASSCEQLSWTAAGSSV